MESGKKTTATAALGLIAAAAAGLVAYYFILRKPKNVSHFFENYLLIVTLISISIISKMSFMAFKNNFISRLTL